MFLLFSHTLTPEQDADARQALGVTDMIPLPDALQTVWSQVPPDIDTLDTHLRPVWEWMQAQAQSGDYVLIQGDFGAVYATVNLAFASQLHPVYATTERKVREIHLPDGSVQSQRVFRHVRYRRYYPSPSE